MKRGSSGGCSSFLLTLSFVFIVLKLTGAVAWSWWWVTAPLWMPVALLAGGVVLAAVMGVSVYKIVSTRLRRQRFGKASDRSTTGPSPRGAGGQVVEAQGTEVTSTPGSRGPKRLPQATSSAEREDSVV